MKKDLIFWCNRRNALAYNFQEALPGTVAFARASTASSFSSTGCLSSAAVDAARFDYDPLTLTPKGLLIEPNRTNYARNSALAGAVVGTPGTLPTNWSKSIGGGSSALTQTIVGAGTEYGMAYVDIRLQGTTTTTGYINYLTDNGYTYHPAVCGDIWTSAFYMRLSGGSMSNVSSIAASMYEVSTGGSYLGTGSLVMPVVDSSLRRAAYTRTLLYATTGYIISQIYIVTGIGAIDVTLRFYQPQLEKASAASSPIVTSTVVATRAADALTFAIPSTITRLRYTFDDDSTQDVTVASGSYTVPTTLNRVWIKKITGYRV